MKWLVVTLKIVLPVGVIVWLLSTIEPEQRRDLLARDKDWSVLALAFAAMICAVCLTFVRWYLLVRALRMDFRLRDAFRLGFLAYMLNFVSFGSSGGDLFKAVFIAREQPGRRTEAVASVVVDRIFGMYALLLLTSVAITLIEIPFPTRAMTAICNLTYLATGLSTAGVLVMLTPGFARGPLSEFLSGLPVIGATMERAIMSIRIFREEGRVMILNLGLSLCVHALLPVAVCLIATSLFASTPTMGEHFIIAPLSNVAGALPFVPAGLGSFEFAMDELYRQVPPEERGNVVGVLVALSYRVITIAIAAVGVVFYWACRREVRQVMADTSLVPGK